MCFSLALAYWGRVIFGCYVAAAGIFFIPSLSVFFLFIVRNVCVSLRFISLCYVAAGLLL